MEYGQDVMVQAEKTNGIGKAEKQAIIKYDKMVRKWVCETDEKK
jgi:hypothetical protein